MVPTCLGILEALVLASEGRFDRLRLCLDVANSVSCAKSFARMFLTKRRSVSSYID
jgi:hypothetical protein